MTESDVAIELFLGWLNRTYERSFRWDEFEATATDGAKRLAIQVRPLIGPTEDGRWLAARERLQEQLATVVPAPVAIWIPAGAELPAGEPATSEFIDEVRRAAVKLGPDDPSTRLIRYANQTAQGERGYVPLPIRLLLRKTNDGGGVVSVTGGMNPHWARFTERVRGTYDLDSTRLHRLPESEEHLESLIDTIVERAGKLEVGQIAEIETVDAWTVQRLAKREGQRTKGKGQMAKGEGEGVTIVGVPAGETADVGLAVRKNFRRILSDVGPKLREQDVELRALVVLGYYARMEQEGATTAMRGYDPGLYAGLDFVCLVADGLVKPLIQARAGVVSG